MRAQDNDRTSATARGRVPARATPAEDAELLPGFSALQSSMGNEAVVQLLRRAGHAGAWEEQQHDGDGHERAAGQPPVQRSAVHDVLRRSGRPLDEATRADMGERFGADFSDVRVHDDAAARASAAEVGARAYTSGNHIVIGAGGGDAHTLAHELTHVVQQRKGPVAGTDNGAGLRVSDPSDRFEREAEANARRVMSVGASARRAEPAADAVTGAAGGEAATVQRMPKGESSNRGRRGGGFNPIGRNKQGNNPTAEQVTENEYAVRKHGKYFQAPSEGRANEKVKHYLIPWKEDNLTLVLGVKGPISPYPDRSGRPQEAYGGGFPAPPGGTSEMSNQEMRALRGGGAGQGPAHGMRDHTLAAEVDQELLRRYRVLETAEITAVPIGDDNYQVWEGNVSAIPEEERQTIPTEGREADSYRENVGTFEVSLIDLYHSGIRADTSNELVLNKVADLARAAFPAILGSDEQRATYLSADNYPNQAIAERIKYWIGYYGAYGWPAVNTGA
ncbi:DUF4157 domain-containing protein [Streptomyces sp. NPDC001777]|uniref:eCIS core domain-containing protein n=1 Tax=Streptomyces sp. NPDC001777 TaxID=3364608 RepID=UPI0036BC1CD4